MHGPPYTYSNILLSKSSDGGATWGLPVQVNDVPFFWDTGQDAMIDAQGVIHATWVDARDYPDERYIYYSHSTDDGASFSPSVRVDDATVFVGLGTPGVGSEGAAKVHVAWADARNYPGGIGCLGCNDEFYAISNGSQSFSANAQINDPLVAKNISGWTALQATGEHVDVVWTLGCLPQYGCPPQYIGSHIWLDVGPYQPTPEPTPLVTPTPTSLATPTATATIIPPTSTPTGISASPSATLTPTMTMTTMPPTTTPTVTSTAGSRVFLPLALKGG
jgi:hypothetical protein